METLGVPFGADLFGKFKMVMQCILLGFLLTILALQATSIPLWGNIQMALIYATLVVTVASGLQYLFRSWPHFNK
jgi:CDP-diacylglycerol---glycerol-3-phosphate 3-phosphatidyltransferase